MLKVQQLYTEEFEGYDKPHVAQEIPCGYHLLALIPGPDLFPLPITSL